VSDEEIVERVKSGETALFEVLMRRYNQRLFRIARSFTRDDVEAEDVVQEAHFRAYLHLGQFEGRAKFATWLTKIALYDAMGRKRREEVVVDFDQMESSQRTPEEQVFDGEVSSLLKTAFDALPEMYRAIFMMREVEGMSTSEAAACLEITEETVKTRLSRARAMLRHELYSLAGVNISRAFTFAGSRCDRIVTTVMQRIASRQSAEVNR
jgi:RNA polymerase sigma-70 factor (ECF subfamily)